MITSDEEAEYNILDQGSKSAIFKGHFLEMASFTAGLNRIILFDLNENFETLFKTFFLTSVAAWEFFWDLVS